MPIQSLARPNEATKPEDLHNPEYLLALFSEEPNTRGVMSNIAYALEDDPISNAAVWTNAIEAAARMDGRPDGYMPEMMQARRPNLQAWKTGCEDGLKDMATTRTPIISNHHIRPAFERAKEGETYNLTDIARFGRHALGFRRVQVAATEILNIREGKLRTKFGLRAHEPILPKHYMETPNYQTCEFADLMAYMNGEHTDAIFSIDGPQDPAATATVEDLTKLTSGQASDIEVEENN
ncbi:MAG: hypothetical protein AAB373_02170 [Patescibacteria group bacterium]